MSNADALAACGGVAARGRQVVFSC